MKQRSAGFTLVEVLVALLIMAVLAGLAWQGLDGVLKARDATRSSIDRTVKLATVLTQWEQDLQALVDTGAVPPISYDGQTLRMTRRGDGGAVLVAWSVRGGLWQRWAAPAVVRSGELTENWLRSQQLNGSEAGHVTLSDGASQWQVYFNRGGQWSNPQSTGNLVQAVPVAPAVPASGAASGAAAAVPAAQTQSREALPEAVRIVVTLGGQTLTRDIALGPAGS